MLAEADPTPLKSLIKVSARQITGAVKELRPLAEELLTQQTPLPTLHRFYPPFLSGEEPLLPVLLIVCPHPSQKDRYLVVGNLTGFYQVRSVAAQTNKEFSVPVLQVDMYPIRQEEIVALEIACHAFNLTAQQVQGPLTAAIARTINASISRGVHIPTAEEIAQIWGVARHTARRIWKRLRNSSNASLPAPEPRRNIVVNDGDGWDDDFSDVPF